MEGEEYASRMGVGEGEGLEGKRDGTCERTPAPLHACSNLYPAQDQSPALKRRLVNVITFLTN